MKLRRRKNNQKGDDVPHACYNVFHKADDSYSGLPFFRLVPQKVRRRLPYDFHIAGYTCFCEDYFVDVDVIICGGLIMKEFPQSQNL